VDHSLQVESSKKFQANHSENPEQHTEAKTAGTTEAGTNEAKSVTD
jgi:hypothetical protein